MEEPIEVKVTDKDDAVLWEQKFRSKYGNNGVTFNATEVALRNAKKLSENYPDCKVTLNGKKFKTDN